MELFKPGRVYDFMRVRKYWIGLSVALSLASLFLIVVYPGPNYGTDFRGGTEIELSFTKQVTAGELRSAIEGAGFASPEVLEVQDPKNPWRFLVRVQEVSAISDQLQAQVKAALCAGVEAVTPQCPERARASEIKFSAGGDKISARYDVPEPDLVKIHEQMVSVPAIKLRGGQDAKAHFVNQRVEFQLQSKGDQLMDGLREKLGKDRVPAEALRVEWVGPKAGKQLRDNARNSVVIAVFFIMLYLALRFDVRFAPGVVLACVHDALVVIAAFILTHREVTLSTISVVLTIVGYSMNDTVVVYDRIRENLSKHRGRSFADIINMSVSETLSRTLLTSGATMLSVLAFLVWGTGVIKDFAFGMVVGIIAGTYSSIYVAAPLTEWIDRRMAKPSDVKKRLQGK